jgi:hypothetical protein
MGDVSDQDPVPLESGPIPFGDGQDPRQRWDADDPRRQKDCFAPPMESCECFCLHCQRTFMSDGIWFQKVINSSDGFEGFWKCPTPNCGGAGFTFDIFPTDPDHPANEGWHYCDDDEEYGEECFDEKGDYIEPEDRVYNPDEPKFKALDEELPEGPEDDLEGEEWKLGLAPGQAPPETESQKRAREEWEEEQRQYDAPDERPRVVDWSDRETERSDGVREDDIPF